MLKVLGTQEIYSNRWMTLTEDKIEFPDGKEGIYSYVTKPPFAIIIPHEEGKVTLVSQYRYPVQSTQWEFPQGALNDLENADPRQIAATELREETGLVASSIVALGSLFPAYGLLRQEMFVFLAEGLTQSTTSLEDEEQGLISRQFSVEEVRQMIRSGEMQDGCSVSAMYLWDDWLRQKPTITS